MGWQQKAKIAKGQNWPFAIFKNCTAKGQKMQKAKNAKGQRQQKAKKPKGQR